MHIYFIFLGIMGLEKAIEHGKEKRKPYRGAKAVDYTCRNHGSCSWCEGNRLYSSKRKLIGVNNEKSDFIKQGKM